MIYCILYIALLFSPALSAGLVLKQYRYKILLVGKTGSVKSVSVFILNQNQ